MSSTYLRSSAPGRMVVIFLHCQFNLGEFFWMYRELKEGKSPGTEPQPSGADVLSDLPAGLLGLEIPPDVRNVLKVNDYLII